MNSNMVIKPGQRNLLLLLAMLYMAAFIFCDVLVKRMIGSNDWYTSGAVIGFPLTFTIADIVAEVYGYQIARNIIWFGFAGDFLFDMLATATIHLPHPQYWHDATSFNVVLSGLPTLFLISFLTSPLSDFLNIYVLVKTKILFKGRFFLVRSVVASALGELIDTLVIGILLTFLYHWQGHEWMIIVVIYIFKIIYALISSIPAAIFASALKKYEGLDVYDYSTNFNPFKLKIE
jgi:uncharacterized integral membrane protein (TIGR00697 family)